MTQNESELDRIIRAVVGVILLLVGYSIEMGVWQVVLYVLGGVAVITSLTGFCMLYKILGISTISKD